MKDIYDLLSYDANTGVFTRLKTTSSRAKKGDVAGYTDSHGYICIGINGKSYKAHRLAWLYHTGEMPDTNLDIDHINGIRSDNRICNLRIATRSDNLANSRLRKNNTTGYKGVYVDGNKFRAMISNKGELIHLGMYNTCNEAYEAYCKAAKEIFGDFANLIK
jgi:hypothetical protein